MQLGSAGPLLVRWAWAAARQWKNLRLYVSGWETTCCSPHFLLPSYKTKQKSINALSSLLTSVIQNKKVSTLKLSFPGCASQVVLLLKKKKNKPKTTPNREKELVFLNNEAAQAGQPGGEHPGSHQYLSDQRPLTICPGHYLPRPVNHAPGSEAPGHSTVQRE